MPKKKNDCNGDLPLPEGWDLAQDYDGKLFFFNHSDKQTTWIDPRDRYTKPASFADCVGDELPVGWEQVFDSQCGRAYYVNHTDKKNQFDDPRLQWRYQQEEMLKDYLVHAHQDLMAKKEIFHVKEERLLLAQEEVQHLADSLAHWKASRTSLNSNSSVGSTKYDPDLLRIDVSLAKNRVSRLKRELQQIGAEMSQKEKGLETLSAVDQKMSEQQNLSVDQAQQIMNQIHNIQQSLSAGEMEKRELMQGLAKIKEEVMMTKLHAGSSPDVSTLSLPGEQLSTASQTDLCSEYSPHDNRWGEIVRIRLQYDEARKQVSGLQEQLAKVEDQMVPGQNESDRDRLMLIAEKEQLLRELRSINPKGKSEGEMASLRERVHQLETDIMQAVDMTNKQIAERLKLNESKGEVLQQLADATRMTTYLESQLKTLSLSTLSISSAGSSRGSLGSLSASSKGSLNDIYSLPSHSGYDVNLTDLHRRVQHLLHGVGISGISTIQEDTTNTTNTECSTVENLAGAAAGHNSAAQAMGSNPYLNNCVNSNISVQAASVSGSSNPYLNKLGGGHSSNLSLMGSNPYLGSISEVPQATPMSLLPGSTLSLSSLSPAVSGHDLGPPPTYSEHIERQQIQSRLSSYDTNLGHSEQQILHSLQQDGCHGNPHSNTIVAPPIQQQQQQTIAVPSSVNPSNHQRLPVPHLPLSNPNVPLSNNCNNNNVPLIYNNPTDCATMDSTNVSHPLCTSTRKNIQYTVVDNSTTDMVSNPPLSPISESSSGVCNNLSGGNTRSVSAAVSDESVAGDSGVFEASGKRLDEFDTIVPISLESAQVQIKLKYEGVEGHLHIGIEQARNLSALSFPQHCQVCIKAALLPHQNNLSFKTLPSPDLHRPKFTDVFKVPIAENKLRSKTLGVHVCCVNARRIEECLGYAHISLASLDPKCVSTAWYNVLSSKLMQGDTSTSSSSESRSSRPSVLLDDTPMPPGDKVMQLLEASSTRLRRSSFSEDKQPTTTDSINKDVRLRSTSFDNTYYRGGSQTSTINSVKEESSDESTIISSQTSTLTRNQGPDDMEGDLYVGDGTHRAEGQDANEEEDDMDDDMEYPMAYVQMIPQEATLPNDIPKESEDDLSPGGTIKVVTCDKETNTEGRGRAKGEGKKSPPGAAAGAAIPTSCIRRSQTFSPTGRAGDDYICKLNRSDSDTSVKYRRGTFQRNATERRSLRYKKAPTLTKSKSWGSMDRTQTRTDLDLELDLQASQTRLTLLNDEISRLKELKKRFDEAKANGESEPKWFAENEQLQQFMAKAEQLTALERKNYTKVEEKAERRLRKATKEVYKLRRSQKQQPDVMSFREKMAFFTTANMDIPVIPSESEAEIEDPTVATKNKTPVTEKTSSSDASTSTKSTSTSSSNTCTEDASAAENSKVSNTSTGDAADDNDVDESKL